MFYAKSQNFIQLSTPTSDEPSVIDLLKSYLSDNSKIGYLIFQVFQHPPLEGVLPVPNAKITVSKLLGENYFISKVITTDNNGKTEPIPLPAVSTELTKVPTSSIKCSKYNARVEAPNFLATDIFDICIFDGITAIQPVDLLPSPGDPIQLEPLNYKKKGKNNGNN